jgi:L-ascorbate metabolism protein UlaG (beta-lactamase superfamily)
LDENVSIVCQIDLEIQRQILFGCVQEAETIRQKLLIPFHWKQHNFISAIRKDVKGKKKALVEIIALNSLKDYRLKRNF